jgi:hypothetical protein
LPKRGYRQSDEHKRKRKKARDDTFMARGADQFFLSVLMLNKADREEVIADRLAEAEEIMAETEKLLAARRGIRNSASADLEQFRKSLLRDAEALLAHRGDNNMTTPYDAAHPPYVSETQTRHAPMTTGPSGHTHDHAAHGAPDHDDGIHGGDGAHTHNNDSDHDHPDQHPHGHMNAGRTPQSGERVSGTYGLQMSDKIGPAERMRLKNQQLRAHEENR